MHPASFDDLQRDRDPQRRSSVVSKLAKYDRLAHPPSPPPDFLQALGNPTTDNDVCDARILYAVQANAVAMLITEDRGIHAKAKRLGIDKRVYYVTQALALIEQLHGERHLTPPAVHRKPMHAVPLVDPIFESLRTDYSGFDDWYGRKAQEGRECWIVQKNDGGVAALCIFNRETNPTPKLPGAWLKLCTFKVAPEMSGRKFGELLLKTAFWHCQLNNSRKHQGSGASARHVTVVSAVSVMSQSSLERERQRAKVSLAGQLAANEAMNDGRCRKCRAGDCPRCHRAAR